MGLLTFTKELRRKADRVSNPTAKVVPDGVAARSAQVELDQADVHNPYWKDTKRASRLTFVRKPIIEKSDKVFTIGSCFAREVKAAFGALGFAVFPEYRKIEFDPKNQKLGYIPTLDHLNHYNTFTIRQEFELAFAGGHHAPDDFIQLVPADIKNQHVLAGYENGAWQDPFRRYVFARDRDLLVDLSRKIDDSVRSAIMACDIYVITLGLTEVWRDRRRGQYFNQPPENRNSESERYLFERSTFEQNYQNMRRVCSLVAEHFPARKIVLTVSPVPLKRTFTDMDVVVANTESKCTLRAVAAAISQEFDNVVYWPSYEIAMAGDMFEANGRDVTREGVAAIVNQFVLIHA